MTFSPQLEAKFAKLLESYPTGRQRAAMIPMLLYAQDEVGSVTDELVEEVAQRVGVTPLQVNEVVSYYSMFYCFFLRPSKSRSSFSGVTK